MAQDQGGVTSAIWTTRPDGTHQRRLIRNGGSPIYAPSGRKFVFDRRTGDRVRVLLADADGSNIRKPPCRRRIENMTQLVAYSPNGKWLLATKDHYRSGEWISSTLVRLSLRSCKRQQIVSGTGDLWDADWQALPAP